MKKLIWILAVAGLLLAALAAFREPLMDHLMRAQIDKTLQRVEVGLPDDGQLHVILCGTAAALPDAKRAGPCTAVLAGGEFILVDAGPGSWRNLDLLDLPLGRLSAVFLTHFHSDHIGELGEATVQSWIAGRAMPLPVFGPPGVEDVVAGFARAYAHDVGYRVEHHDEEFMPRQVSGAVAKTFAMPNGDELLPVFERNGLKIGAFRVEHAPVDAAVGYRIEYAGRVVVISGDTVKSDAVIRNARGADILIHEALAAHMTERAAARARELGMTRLGKLASDVRDYHTTPVQAAEVAQAAGVKELVLSHIFPPIPNRLAERLLLQGTAAAFGGKIVLGEDGMRFDLAPRE